MKNSVLFICAIVCVFLGLTMNAGAASVEIDVGLDGIFDTGTIKKMNAGETTSVGVYISGIDSTNGIGGFMANIEYDETKLEVSNVLLNRAAWDSDGLTTLSAGNIYAEGFSAFFTGDP